MQIMTSPEISKRVGHSTHWVNDRTKHFRLQSFGKKKLPNCTRKLYVYDYDEFMRCYKIVGETQNKDKIQMMLFGNVVRVDLLEQKREAVHISSFSEAVRANWLAGIKVAEISKRVGRRIIEVFDELHRQGLSDARL